MSYSKKNLIGAEATYFTIFMVLCGVFLIQLAGSGWEVTVGYVAGMSLVFGFIGRNYECNLATEIGNFIDTLVGLSK